MFHDRCETRQRDDRNRIINKKIEDIYTSYLLQRDGLWPWRILRGQDGSVERLRRSVETDAWRRQRSEGASRCVGGARSCKQQSQGGDGGQAQDGVPGLVDALDVGLVTRVPDHVSDTVPRVEGEGDAGNGLEGDLSGDREAGKESHERGRVDKADGVRAGHDEEAGGQADTSDSVERRQHGRQLLLVDLQVW